MRFRNPANGYVAEHSLPALWAFLFGAVYYMIVRLWIPMFLSLVGGLGIAWAIGSGGSGGGGVAGLLGFAGLLGLPVLAMMTPSMLRSTYLRRGWEEVDDKNNSSMALTSKYRRCPFCAEEILALAVKCKHCGSIIETGHSSTTPAKEMTDQHHMEAYGIIYNGSQYVYGQYKYDLLEDAVRFAKHASSIQNHN